MPTDEAAKALSRLVGSGVDVAILTNSLAATDVAAVHSGYAHYRPQLIKGGVRLFELQLFDHAPLAKKMLRLFAYDTAPSMSYWLSYRRRESFAGKERPRKRRGFTTESLKPVGHVAWL